VTQTFGGYQRHSRETAIYPEIGNNIVYPTLGLAGEAGEVAETVKKMVRDDDGKLTDERKATLVKELGDVLWYLSQIASEIEVNLAYIAGENIKKLASRKERGVLKGSGNDR
jgi:NTP pyrophosphatase (non-canonical NTP hydrolase)